MSRRPQSGQALVMAVALLLMCCFLVLFLFQVGMTAREKIRLQTTADLALLSALHAQANSLNALAVENRAILAQDAFAGRLNALVSESAFIRRLLEGVSWLVRLIPYAGPALGAAVSKGGRAFEQACLAAARAGTPPAAAANAVLGAQSAAVRASLVPLPLAAAVGAAKANAPSARISPVSQAALLRQGRDLAAGIRPLPAGEVKRLVDETLDPHSRKRDWKVMAGTLPVRKTGGTTVESRDLKAFDRLEFKVFSKGKWRWKSIIATSSRASRFGYKGHGTILEVDREAVPRGLTVVLTQKAPAPLGWLPPPTLPLTAVSSGRILYRRDRKPVEAPTLLNPFWTARMIPVAEEEGARKALPAALLKEIRH